MMTKQQRARGIVRAAAQRIEDREVKSWLELDERGTWESIVLGILECTAERMAELEIGDTEVDDALADHVALAALTAVLKSRSTGTPSAYLSSNPAFYLDIPRDYLRKC